MKNVSLLLAHMTLNSSAPGIARVEPMARQGKFYGPLLGFMLANLLAKPIAAKYFPFGSLQFRYDPNPWLAYNKPQVHEGYNYEPPVHYPNSVWQPVKPPQTYYGIPPLTTESSHFHHHHIVKPLIPNQQQIVHIHEHSSPSGTGVDFQKPEETGVGNDGTPTGMDTYQPTNLGLPSGPDSMPSETQLHKKNSTTLPTKKSKITTTKRIPIAPTTKRMTKAPTTKRITEASKTKRVTKSPKTKRMTKAPITKKVLVKIARPRPESTTTTTKQPNTTTKDLIIATAKETIINSTEDITSTTNKPDQYSTLSTTSKTTTDFDDELVAAESSIRRQRVTTLNYRRRTTTERPKYRRGTQRYSNGKRRRYNSDAKRRRLTTTTPSYYYDSYEDFSTENFKPTRRKTKPKRPAYYSEESYEDDYEYDEDYDYTTEKPFIKKRRTPTTKRSKKNKTNRNKNKKRQQVTAIDDYSDENYDFDYRDEPFTQAAQFNPRQATTSESSTLPTTTARQQTEITNGTTPSSNSSMNTTTPPSYGYGPSNGNENISITYGPPYNPPFGPYPSYGPPRPSYGPPASAFGQFQIQQYTDWYNDDATKNAIVKKVQDIIGLGENIFQRR